MAALYGSLIRPPRIAASYCSIGLRPRIAASFCSFVLQPRTAASSCRLVLQRRLAASCGSLVLQPRTAASYDDDNNNILDSSGLLGIRVRDLQGPTEKVTMVSHLTDASLFTGDGFIVYTWYYKWQRLAPKRPGWGMTTIDT